MKQVASPVRFGHSMLEHWALDPDVLYLNHGTVGAPPRRVLAAQQAIRDEIERQPSRFLLRELSTPTSSSPAPRMKPRLRAAADQVAAFLGAKGDDLAFVDNVTEGLNAVLRSLDFKPGDEVVITDFGYGAVNKAAAFAARRGGATVRMASMPHPIPDEGAMVEAVASALSPRTRLVVVDHVTSETALILPVREIAVRCKARGVPVLADGAHAPGALDYEIPALGVDWYSANLHKWAWSPRSCGILWAAPARQSGLHPPVLSWGLEEGFLAEFDCVGTRDPSAALAAPEGIAFMRELGVEAVRSYDHALAWEAATFLGRRWGTSPGVPEAMVGTMACVPLPERAGSTRPEAMGLRDALLYEDRIEAQVHAWRGRVWVRISAQIYNEMSDVERFAKAAEARIGA